MHSVSYRFAIGSLLLAGAQFAIAQTATTPATAGSAIKGKEIYDARCSACHSVDDNRVGPKHLGVFGRKAGGVKNYRYSVALSKSKVVWDRDNLLAWLKNPEAVIPGQSMGYSLDIAEDRSDVVAFFSYFKVIFESTVSLLAYTYFINHLRRTHMRRQLHTLSLISIAAVLSACSMGKPSMQNAAFDQSTLPTTIQVPAGHTISMETVGVGSITYECKPKANMNNQFEWVFVGPEAKLLARSGAEIGRYYGPPATWRSADGSAITGTQLAVSPAQPGSIPLQLVKANPAMGQGKMSNVSYIQRVATQDGVAPQKVCDATTVGGKEVVKYKADYIFWRPV